MLQLAQPGLIAAAFGPDDRKDCGQNGKEDRREGETAKSGNEA